MVVGDQVGVVIRKPLFFYNKNKAGIVIVCAKDISQFLFYKQEAQSYADDNSLLFMETSAKTSMNVNEIFMAIGKINFFANSKNIGRTSYTGGIFGLTVFFLILGILFCFVFNDYTTILDFFQKHYFVRHIVKFEKLLPIGLQCFQFS